MFTIEIDSYKPKHLHDLPIRLQEQIQSCSHCDMPFTEEDKVMYVECSDGTVVAWCINHKETVV